MSTEPVKRGRGRPRKHPVVVENVAPTPTRQFQETPVANPSVQRVIMAPVTNTKPVVPDINLKGSIGYSANNPIFLTDAYNSDCEIYGILEKMFKEDYFVQSESFTVSPYGKCKVVSVLDEYNRRHIIYFSVPSQKTF